MFIRQQYGADYYSGANVTLSIGGSILTQAAGIDWSVEQTKKPIYGYNSQYFDSVAKGIVIVNGRLYINYVSPRYLTTTIHRFYQTVRAWQRGLDADDPSEFIEHVSEDPDRADLFQAIMQSLMIPESAIPLINEAFPGAHTTPFPYEIDSSNGDLYNTSPEEMSKRGGYQADFGVMLNNVFESDSSRRGMERLIWGDEVQTGMSSANDEVTGTAFMATTQLERQFAGRDIVNVDRPLSALSSYARPDQIGHATDGYEGIDIMVSYGNVFESQITDSAFQYDHATSQLIKDVHFTGQSQAIFVDNKPVLDVYTFMARRINPQPTPARVSPNAATYQR